MLKVDLEEMEKDGRNWEEDYNHENGDYVNKCVYCDKMFRGHKRRVVCQLPKPKGLGFLIQ